MSPTTGCGCRVVVYQMPPLKPGEFPPDHIDFEFTVEHCPLHREAEAMLGALRKLGCTCIRGALEQEGYHDGNCNLIANRDLIERAEGRGNSDPPITKKEEREPK